MGFAPSNLEFHSQSKYVEMSSSEKIVVKTLLKIHLEFLTVVEFVLKDREKEKKQNNKRTLFLGRNAFHLD